MAHPAVQVRASSCLDGGGGAGPFGEGGCTTVKPRTRRHTVSHATWRMVYMGYYGSGFGWVTL